MRLERSSGVLLHITSLPGKHGTGTLGPEAREFAGQLKKAGMKYWQILPIGPVAAAFDFCPYASPSTFAGNPLFISLEDLAGEPWCSLDIPPYKNDNDHFVDFYSVLKHKMPLLHRAYDQFQAAPEKYHRDYLSFCSDSAWWLDDFSLYATLAKQFDTLDWTAWDHDIALREPAALKKWNEKLAPWVDYNKFLQYIFFTQWAAFKKECNDQGISLIGDIPIYITMDGADSWSHRDMLQLDPETGRPHAVSGVPPDYFSATGQRWGNPLYQWTDEQGGLHEATYQWWKKRIQHLHRYIDIIRIDHFRGFEAYWSIPTDEETAIRGAWVKGPDIAFFNRLRSDVSELPLIAEDLGVITPEVEKLRDDLGLPGMKILQFAFDFNNKNYYLPHCYEDSNYIVYTGTHDNNTTNGWFYGSEISDETRKYVLEYLGADDDRDFHWKLIRQAYRSVAKLVIFPAQDLLGYGAEFRMNTPGTSTGNWRWKLSPGAITDEIIEKLNRMGHIYNRNPREEIKKADNHLDK